MKTLIGTALEPALYWLKQGEVVAIPTETVYGLAAHGFNETAIAKVFAVKQRPRFNPLIYHVATIEQLYQCVAAVSEEVKSLINTFWPGPLTLVLPAKQTIPLIARAGLPTVAVRMPKHPLTLELIQRLEAPVVAPSANPFGYLSPTTAQHVYKMLQGKIPYILDGDTTHFGVESTIIDCSQKPFRLLRPGAIEKETLERHLGYSLLWETNQIKAPGMLKRHYAPHTPLIITKEPETFIQKYQGKVAIIDFHQRWHNLKDVVAYYKDLSPQGDLLQAAQNLFVTLHEIETKKLQAILTDWLPNHGLGIAINDKLRRAAH